MKTLYIDFFDIVMDKGVANHGGLNYAKLMVKKIIQYIIQHNLVEEYRIVLLCSSLHIDELRRFKNIENQQFLFVECIDVPLEKYEFVHESIIFIPLLPVRRFPLLKKLANLDIKVVITVHGLRVLDLSYDKYDTYYSQKNVCGILNPISNVFLLCKKIVYCHFIRQFLPYAEAVITDSNYSLSKIVSVVSLNRVWIQYQGVEKNNACLSNVSFVDNYILFVSGNRKEKNLARTLDAYKKYKDNTKNPLIFKIVGVNKSVQLSLIKKLELGTLVKEGYVQFYNYVTDEELSGYYKNAKFLLYTSKSEGYGLPALEAAKWNCPVVAAYGTSIPEVLEECAIYVNPYSVESICEGMVKMEAERQQQYFRKKLLEKVKAIDSKVDNSYEKIIENIFNIFENIKIH